MKVNELILKLSQCPQEAEVFMKAWNGQISTRNIVNNILVPDNESYITIIESSYYEDALDEYLHKKGGKK